MTADENVAYASAVFLCPVLSAKLYTATVIIGASTGGRSSSCCSRGERWDLGNSNIPGRAGTDAQPVNNKISTTKTISFINPRPVL